MKLLIDGDVIAYRAACRAERKYWIAEYRGEKYDFESTKRKEILALMPTDEKLTIKSPLVKWTERIVVDPPQFACHSAKLILENMFNTLGVTDGFKVYLTSEDKSNFRFVEAKTWGYKANRIAKKPDNLPAVREYLAEHWGASYVFGMEADDQLMIDHHEDLENSIICSVDKDFKCAARHMYDIAKGTVTHLTKEDNCKAFWYQVLYGDKADNIPGIREWMTARKFGPVACNRFVDDVGGIDDNKYYKSLQKLYLCHRLIKSETEEEAIAFLDDKLNEIGSLLWILRWVGDKWVIPKK